MPLKDFRWPFATGAPRVWRFEDLSAKGFANVTESLLSSKSSRDLFDEQLWGWLRGWNSKDKLCVHDVFVRSGKFVQGAGLFWSRAKPQHVPAKRQQNDFTYIDVRTSHYGGPVKAALSRNDPSSGDNQSRRWEISPCCGATSPDERTMRRAVTSAALASALRLRTLKGFSESPANATD